VRDLLNVKPDLQSMSKGSSVASDRPVQVIRPLHSPGDVIVSGMRSLVQSAGLLRAMTVTHLKMRYRYSLLGWCWALLQPLTLMVLYTLIFSHLVSYSDASPPYALFVFAGLTPWAFCSTSISTSAAGMLNHRSLMATVYFPREIVPISFVVASLIDPAIAFVVLLTMMVYYSIPISVTVLLAIPIFVVLAILVISICLFVSSVQVRIRDISAALPLVLQVLVFTTPIVYPASAVPAALESLYWLNPFAILVQSFREAVIGGGVPHAGDMVYCTGMAVVCFLISYLIFKKIEPTIVDDM
jgi:lipopolysaccharide transport system permease protein